MLTLGPLGFTAPWLLLGLAALPILWLILRAVPPAPIRRRFPGVALLLGLSDDETQTARTPWWLLLLRMLAIAAVIIAFAGPVLNPEDREPGTGPLLVVMDGSWASAPDWPRRLERLDAALAEAGRDGRPVAVEQLTAPSSGDLQFLSADAWRERVAGLQPTAFAPDAAAQDALTERLPGTGFDTLWLSDGLDRDRARLLSALQAQGDVRVFQSPRPIYGLPAPIFEDGAIQITAKRTTPQDAATLTVQAYGLDPAGIERALAEATLDFAPGESEAETALTLPPELRNRITRIEAAGLRSAGAVALTDDALKRREVALMSGRAGREGLELLSPLLYLSEALVPTADLIDGEMTDILRANPDVLILADMTDV
ncbi:MAG: BatA domain-containing protein, partial [Shimia sp.]